MSEGTPGDGLLDDAVREYRRLFHDARLEGQPWDSGGNLGRAAHRTCIASIRLIALSKF
jgi:hypothetical protein